MQTHDLVRARRRRSERGDRDGRGVGREDRVGTDDTIQLAEDRDLGVAIFRRGLDDQLNVGEGRDVGRPPDPLDERVALLVMELSPLDRTSGRSIDPVASARKQLFGRLQHDDLDPDTGEDLGDTGTHETETHHTDPVDVLGLHDLLPSDTEST